LTKTHWQAFFRKGFFEKAPELQKRQDALELHPAACAIFERREQKCES